MSGSTARLDAIAAVTQYKPISPPMNFAETPSGELFGSNRFRPVRNGKAAAEGGLQVAEEDDRAGRKARHHRGRRRGRGHEGLGYRKGGHALRPRLLPAHRPDRRKARQLPLPRRAWRGGCRVLRQGPDPGRARRFELSLGRHPRHVRGPRLHGLGRDQPGLHPGKPQRHDALHSRRRSSLGRARRSTRRRRCCVRCRL